MKKDENVTTISRAKILKALKTTYAIVLFLAIEEISPDLHFTNERNNFEKALDCLSRLLVGDEVVVSVVALEQKIIITSNYVDHSDLKFQYFINSKELKEKGDDFDLTLICVLIDSTKLKEQYQVEKTFTCKKNGDIWEGKLFFTFDNIIEMPINISTCLNLNLDNKNDIQKSSITPKFETIMDPLKGRTKHIFEHLRWDKEDKNLRSYSNSKKNQFQANFEAHIKKRFDNIFNHIKEKKDISLLIDMDFSSTTTLKKMIPYFMDLIKLETETLENKYFQKIFLNENNYEIYDKLQKDTFMPKIFISSSKLCCIGCYCTLTKNEYKCNGTHFNLYPKWILCDDDHLLELILKNQYEEFKKLREKNETMKLDGNSIKKYSLILSIITSLGSLNKDDIEKIGWTKIFKSKHHGLPDDTDSFK
eukprot:gene11407-4574_t